MSRVDRDKAEEVLNEAWADVTKVAVSIEEWVDRIEECVLPDPRIAKLQAFLTGAEHAEYEEVGPTYVQTDSIRAILDGYGA